MSGTEAMRVRECLGGLERIDRYVVLMYFADELTPAEIGLVLDIPSSRVTRTLENFRDKVSRTLTLRDQRRDAKAFVAAWLNSSRSALV